MLWLKEVPRGSCGGKWKESRAGSVAAELWGSPRGFGGSAAAVQSAEEAQAETGCL